jgi:dynein heavy chain
LHSSTLLSFVKNVVGIGGSGRSSVARLAAFMSDYEIFQIEITKNYNTTDWTEDVKKVLRKAGYNGIPTVFLFGDHQIKVLVLCSCIL